MPQPLLLCIVGLLGLAVGSFLNVVIHRVPDNQSLVRPGSHCPHCGAAIRNRHNIPVLGWLVLRGKCADCKAPISGRYPLVEVLTAALFVAVTARFGLSWDLPAYLYLATIAIALTMIDLDRFRLPDAIVWPSYYVAVALLVPAAVLTGQMDAVFRGLAAALALWLLFLAIRLFGPMGWGDIKLAPLLGFYLGWLGWGAVAVGTFAAFLLGGLVGVALLLARVAKGKTRIPFGPYMLAGAFVAVFAAAPIADWYLNLITPPIA
jgi:leader peptidase (prepilin peptidase) / N-methyltransferase